MEDSKAAASTPPAPENVCAMELRNCLHVGLDVFLDASPGNHHSKRFPARVRGWECGHYLIVGLDADNATPAVRQGKECVIRFMHEGEVWGFTALFADYLQAGDHPLIQLHWPSEVARVQVRKHERVAIQIPCTAELDDGDTASGAIGDLSGGGCSLLLDREIAVGAGARLSFRMPDGGQVRGRRVIVRNRKKAPGTGFKYGCQFEASEEKDHSIELYVARKIATERGESAPHPQLLVLSRDEEDVEAARHALADSPYEVVLAAGLLDLGYRLRTCNAAGILVSTDQKELAAPEVLPLLRQTPGLEEMPLFLYGESETQAQSSSLGVTHCLAHISDAAEILPHLPEQPRTVAAEPRPAPAGAPPAPQPEATPASAGAAEEIPGAVEEDDDEIRFEE